MEAFDEVEQYSIALFNSSPEECIRAIVEAIVGSQRGVAQFGTLIGTLNLENYRCMRRLVSETREIFNTRKAWRQKKKGNRAVDLAVANLKKDIEEGCYAV